MRSVLLILLSLSLAVVPGLAGDHLVVVSMRQYLIKGSSRIHLYLYAMDGTFKKALTSDDAFNDLNPVFSADGKSVRFTREAASSTHPARTEKYLLDLDSGAIRPCDPGTDFFSRVTCDQFSYAFGAHSEGWLNRDTGFYQSPDGKFTLRQEASAKEDGPCTYQVAATGKDALPVAGLPGFIPQDESSFYDNFQVCNGSPFVTDGSGMELVFLSHHLGSTDGNQMWGLDLTTMQGTKISENGATIYHPPSASGVFVISEARYQPLGDTGKTVNCSYLMWWDAHLKPVRYGPNLSVCYSAAIYGGLENTSVVVGGED